MQPDKFIITDATGADFAQIQAIYTHYVESTTVSLEEIPPTINEMLERWKHSTDKSMPYLTAKENGRVVGYAYAFPYRVRTAYRFTVEESVYIHPDYKGQGIGRLLLQEIISQCARKSYRQMVAVIAGNDNIASIKFHESLGFQKAGVLHNVGFKFDKWIDTTIMQKNLP